MVLQLRSLSLHLLVVLAAVFWPLFFVRATTPSQVDLSELAHDLHSAIETQAVSAVRSRLAHFSRYEEVDLTPFVWAAVFRGDTSIYRAVIRSARTSQSFHVNRPAVRTGGTLLHAAAFAGNSKIVADLIRRGASIHAKDNSGNTPVGALMLGWSHAFDQRHGIPLAAEGNRFAGTRSTFSRSLKAMLSKKPDLNTLLFALHEASSRFWGDGVGTVVERLQRRAHVLEPEHFHSALLESMESVTMTIQLSKWLTQHGNVAVPSHLLEKYPSGERFDSFEFNGMDVPAGVASEDGFSYDRARFDRWFFGWHRDRILAPILSLHQPMGSVAWARDGRGNSAVHLASYRGNAEGVKMLLDWAGDAASRVEVNQRNSRRLTPIQLAGIGNFDAAVKVLVDAGARATDLEQIPFYGPEGSLAHSNGNFSGTAEVRPHSDEDTREKAAVYGGWNTDPMYPRSGCAIDVMEVWDPVVFAESYFRYNRPVLIRSYPPLQNAEAFSAWDRENFVRAHQQETFSIFGKRDPSNRSKRATTFEMSLDDFLMRTETADSTSGLEPLWLVETESSTSGAHADLASALPRFNFLEELLAPEGFGYNNFQFMISPHDTGASPHFHNSALNVLVYGAKEWLLYPPAHAYYSTKHVQRWYREDYMSREDHAALGEPLVCVQQAGEIIYVPDMWGHAVLSRGTSVGMAHLFTG